MDQNKAARLIALSRLLTRLGDHAWDLAIPILLIKLYPGTLGGVALYFIITTIGKIFLITPLSRRLDHVDRLFGVGMAIGAQIAGAVAIGCLVAADLASHSFFEEGVGQWLFFVLLGLCGATAQVGASLTYICVGSDWVPKLFDASHFSVVNSKIKRADLLTEILAPLAGGMILTWKYGFFLILLLNISSFAFEYAILRAIYRANSKLARAPIHIVTAESFLRSLSRVYRTLRLQYAAPTMLAYALLWFQVLTPHGSILTAYLKDVVEMGEDKLGVFRALGALFGLLPTFLFAKLSTRYSMPKLAFSFISLQLLCMLAACFLLEYGAIYLFLLAILFSRIGLYGFSLAEVQIRQETVPEEMRAEVAGAGAALCNLVHLIFYICVLQFSELSHFKLLAWASVAAATFAAISTLMLRRPSTDSRANSTLH